MAGPSMQMAEAIWRTEVRVCAHDLVQRLGVGTEKVPDHAKQSEANGLLRWVKIRRERTVERTPCPSSGLQGDASGSIEGVVSSYKRRQPSISGTYVGKVWKLGGVSHEEHRRIWAD